MLAAGVDTQFFHLRTSLLGLWHHALYGLKNDNVWRFCHLFAHRAAFQATWITRMAVVAHRVHLVTSDNNAFAISDHYKITTIYVGAEGWFMFAAQDTCNLSSETTQGLASSICHPPLTALQGFFGAWTVCLLANNSSMIFQ